MGVTTEQVMALISKSHKPDHEAAVELLELARSAGLGARVVRPLAAYVAGLPEELALKGRLDKLRGDNAALWGEAKGAASDPFGGEQLDIAEEAERDKDEGGRMKDEVEPEVLGFRSRFGPGVVRDIFGRGLNGLCKEMNERALLYEDALAGLLAYIMTPARTLPGKRGLCRQPVDFNFKGTVGDLRGLVERFWLYYLGSDDFEEFSVWDHMMGGASDEERRLVAEGLLELMGFDARGVLMDERPWDSLRDDQQDLLHRFLGLPGMMGGMPWEPV
jgi:hypothetical protein